jgi:hypothetical protein
LDIEFPFGEYWQPLENFVGFRAMVNSDRIDCHITQKALVKHFKGRGKDPIDVFKANRKAIEEVTAGLLKARKKGNIEPLSIGIDDIKKG